MKLLLVRHAIAEDVPPHGGSDFDRALTSKGREQFSAFAEWLVRQEIQPQRVFHSPLVRAVQTAELLCTAAELDPAEQLLEPVLSPGIDLTQLVRRLRDWRDEGLRTVACVGHQPDMSRIAAQLIGGGALEFKKGATACIEFSGSPQAGAGVLRWLASPKLVRDE